MSVSDTLVQHTFLRSALVHTRRHIACCSGPSLSNPSIQDFEVLLRQTRPFRVLLRQTRPFRVLRQTRPFRRSSLPQLRTVKPAHSESARRQHHLHAARRLNSSTHLPAVCASVTEKCSFDCPLARPHQRLRAHHQPRRWQHTLPVSLRFPSALYKPSTQHTKPAPPWLDPCPAEFAQHASRSPRRTAGTTHQPCNQITRHADKAPHPTSCNTCNSCRTS